MIPSGSFVTPATRIRLTYKVSVGILSGLGGLNAAIDGLNEFLQNKDDLMYVVTRASAPESGGGLVRQDYFVTVDLMTNSQVPTVTWGDALRGVQNPSLGWAGIDARADLTDSAIVARTNIATTTTQQGRTTHTAATAAQATQPVAQISKALTGVGIAIVAILAVVVFVKVKK
jgi:hypothetical protein